MTISHPTTDPLSPVVISHESGSSATVHPFGACVISFKTSTSKEVIFVSRLAKHDGSKAIRGGIPLCFPQFGQPDKSMPQHGFMRCNLWQIGRDYEEEGSACCDFILSLASVVKARGGKWEDGTDLDFVATYTVKLSSSSMKTCLKVRNTGVKSFDFQMLLHSYYRVDGRNALDETVCNVMGLSGYSVIDKVTGAEYVQGEEPIIVDREVDRIYHNPTKPCLQATVNTGIKISLSATASVDQVQVPVGCVIWNPYVSKSKTMSDFADDEYHDMICVEPGILNNVPPLAQGKEALFEQVVTPL